MTCQVNVTSFWQKPTGSPICVNPGIDVNCLERGAAVAFIFRLRHCWVLCSCKYGKCFIRKAKIWSTDGSYSCWTFPKEQKRMEPSIETTITVLYPVQVDKSFNWSCNYQLTLAGKASPASPDGFRDTLETVNGFNRFLLLCNAT